MANHQYEAQLQEAAKVIKEATHVLVTSGAGIVTVNN
jgi:NAD-dependent SIR2 family protein deacetylase